MALIDALSFKTIIDAAASALTDAWTDTIDDGVALEIKHPTHPLRRVDKLFKFDPKTGIVTTDADYIDAAYAGSMPNKSSRFDTITDDPVAP